MKEVKCNLVKENTKGTSKKISDEELSIEDMDEVAGEMVGFPY